MKIFSMVMSLLVVSLLSACGFQTAENLEIVSGQTQVQTFESPNPNTEGRQPVLVELFTSEGCSSCPPADRQLTFLEKQQPVSGAEIITLAFHVDYWDRLGWKDAFSSAEYSARQESYTIAMNLDSNYTPQMVVDGAQEFVGSNAGRANDAVSKATTHQKGNVELSLTDSKADISIDQLPKHEAATVFIAAAEDNIVTNVRAGENSGRTLAHTSVVRQLQQVGPVAASDLKYKSSAELPKGSGWNKGNLKYVVFVQENKSKKIIAVGRAKAVTK